MGITACGEEGCPHLTSLAGLGSRPDCAELATAAWEVIQTLSPPHNLPDPSPLHHLPEPTVCPNHRLPETSDTSLPLNASHIRDQIPGTTLLPET